MSASTASLPTVAPPDGGYGWVIATSGCLINVIYSACQVSFAILLPELTEAFPDHTNAGIATIGAVQNGCVYFGALISGWLMSMFSCRLVCIFGLLLSSAGNASATFTSSFSSLLMTYSLMGGLGIGIAGVPANVVVQQYFSKKRAMAAGIATAGTSLGALIFAPSLRLIINATNWRETLTWLAAFSIQSVVAAMLFIPLKKQCTSPEDRKTAILSVQSLHDMTNETFQKLKKCLKKTSRVCSYPCGKSLFAWFMVCTFFESFGLATFFAMNADRAIFYGISKEFASYLPAVYGLFSTLTRLFTGLFGDRLAGKRAAFYSGAIIAQGLVVCVSIFSEHNYPAQIAFAGLHGVAFGASVAILPAALVDIVTLKGFPAAYAFTQTTRGIGSFAALPLAGYLLDITGDYIMTFIVNGSICCVGGIFLLLASVHNIYKRSNNSVDIDETLTEIT